MILRYFHSGIFFQDSKKKIVCGIENRFLTSIRARVLLKVRKLMFAILSLRWAVMTYSTP